MFSSFIHLILICILCESFCLFFFFLYFLPFFSSFFLIPLYLPCFLSLPFSIPVALGRNQPLKRERPKWKSDYPMTEGQLRSKRDEFWDTAPAFEGRKEIWDALRAAASAFESNDHLLAQAILDGASITLPHGNTYFHIGGYRWYVFVLRAVTNQNLWHGFNDACFLAITTGSYSILALSKLHKLVGMENINDVVKLPQEVSVGFKCHLMLKLHKWEVLCHTNNFVWVASLLSFMLSHTIYWLFSEYKAAHKLLHYSACGSKESKNLSVNLSYLTLKFRLQLLGSTVRNQYITNQGVCF